MEPTRGSVLANRFNFIGNLDAEKFAINYITLNPKTSFKSNFHALDIVWVAVLALNSAIYIPPTSN